MGTDKRGSDWEAELLDTFARIWACFTAGRTRWPGFTELSRILAGKRPYSREARQAGRRTPCSPLPVVGICFERPGGRGTPRRALDKVSQPRLATRNLVLPPDWRNEHPRGEWAVRSLTGPFCGRLVNSGEANAPKK